jgi:hypothetical protein
VQTANSLEAAAVVSGLSTKLTAEEQAYHVGQAWEALPEPKRQFTFYIVKPEGEALSFHIGPHAPTIQSDDVQLVHRLWLQLRRSPEMQDLHHSDILTYAITRLANEYVRDKQSIQQGLQSSMNQSPDRGLGSPRMDRIDSAGPGYAINAPEEALAAKGSTKSDANKSNT